MPLQSLDIVRRSATTLPPPGVRDAATGRVAKLIDTTKCIGCKACQVACMEWNDLRDEIGTNVGVYDNPPDLTDKSWTVMRFAEYENPNGNLEWLIRKDGCMHCADPGCVTRISHSSMRGSHRTRTSAPWWGSGKAPPSRGRWRSWGSRRLPASSTSCVSGATGSRIATRRRRSRHSRPPAAALRPGAAAFGRSDHEPE